MAVGAEAKTKIVQRLTPTAHAPDASGVAKLVLRKPTAGTFTVKVRRLPGGKSFDVVVNKVKVGTLRTAASGNATVNFSTAGHAAALGFDPRGAQVAIREQDTGDDDLEAGMPDNKPDSALGCCLGAECEDEVAADCIAHGGTPTAAGGCLPDPCNGNPPPTTVVCCRTTGTGSSIDDDPQTECEDSLSSAECAAQGGMEVQGTSCDPNPCQPTPPPNLVICCVPDGNESQCERITLDACTAAGGTANASSSCDPDPCGSSGSGNGGD
jgi:hypothetical protein